MGKKKNEFPFDFDKDEMDKCCNDFWYFFENYYKHTGTTKERFSEIIESSDENELRFEIKNWCIPRVKRRNK